MRKTYGLLLLICVLLLTGCGHKHKWVDADCVNPATCSECGQTNGEPLGHSWDDATCTIAQKCSACGEIYGQPLDHIMMEATCISPERCAACDKTEGSKLGHLWMDATCEEPQICSRCGEKLLYGRPLGHSVEKWSVTKYATCARPGLQVGFCTICEKNVQEEIVQEHTPGVIRDINNPDGLVSPGALIGGTLIQKCTECGEILSKSTASERESTYKSRCYDVEYEDLARNLSQYKGKYVTFVGQVWVMYKQKELADCIEYEFNLHVDGDHGQPVRVEYTTLASYPRILEDDWVVIYGTVTGDTTYGGYPVLDVQYVDFR